MKTIVLDTNELTKDFMLAGLKYQLFEHLTHLGWAAVYIPSTVLEELIANHARAVANAGADLARLNRQRRHLGLAAAEATPESARYPDYIKARLDERLSFHVMPWPSVPHRALVERAVARRPPFNGSGGGYRDALVWADVVELASSGQDVALVSMDKAFAGDDGTLAPELQAEIEPLAGTVELVRDFNRWLLAALPWETMPDLESALTVSRTSEFYEYYLTSDFQDDLQPTVEELGFSLSPYSLAVEEVTWDGDFEPIEGVATESGLQLIEFALGQTVKFIAVFPEGVEIEPEWHVSEPDLLRRVNVEGSVAMKVRIGVLFGGDEGASIEALQWERADGMGRGASLEPAGPGPDQMPLFNAPNVGGSSVRSL